MRFFALFFMIVFCASIPRAPRPTHYDNYPVTTAVQTDKKIIDFYSRSRPYGEFSNFALFPIFVDGQWWPTSEHYYQAMKYEEKELIAWVQAAPDPMEAANRGRDKNVPKRADWEQVKDTAMEIAVLDKFTRDPALKTLLQPGLLLEKIRESLRSDPT
jgi:ribA/ribD-fused uncharacterized protein